MYSAWSQLISTLMMINIKYKKQHSTFFAFIREFLGLSNLLLFSSALTVFISLSLYIINFSLLTSYGYLSILLITIIVIALIKIAFMYKNVWHDEIVITDGEIRVLNNGQIKALFSKKDLIHSEYNPSYRSLVFKYKKGLGIAKLCTIYCKDIEMRDSIIEVFDKNLGAL